MRTSRGFTLLEVMMAIAILGLGLSVLLGAQTGLFASATRAEHISVATGLARCRMSELELELLQKGFPLIDQESEGNCCMDESMEGYDCSWKVQVVELPDPPLSEGVDTDGGLAMGTGTGTGTGTEGSGGPMDALMKLQQSVKTPGETPDLGALAGEFSGAMGGSDAIAGMMMGMVYPSLKPMLQASIRKVIVSVRWREGIKARTLDVTQYITDPQQAAVESEMARGGLDQLSNAVFPGQGMGGTSASSGSGAGTGTGSAARSGR